MSSSIDALRVRAVLGRRDWSPPRPWGPDGWRYTHADGSSVIVSCAPLPDDQTDWVHASIAHPDRMPSYDELQALHRAVWHGRGYAVQVFPPDDRHLSDHEYALHLWGRLDGTNPLPEFGRAGHI